VVQQGAYGKCATVGQNVKVRWRRLMLKREKKIKQWKLREETVRRKFEENVRIIMEGTNDGWN